MVTVPSPSTSTVQPRLRSTSAISGTSRISGQFVIVGRALGEQGRGHQLQHAVLGPDDIDRTRQPGPAAHCEMLSHGGRR